MNNEPVAWMMVNRENTSAYLTFEKPTRDMKISHQPTPLYTHPVKEQDTDCQYCKQGCIRCDARKQLTDEEIAEVFDNTFKVRDFEDAFLKFARAILRKALK
jgi:hypothetical protein